MKFLHKMTHKMTKSVGTAGFALLLIGATGGAFVATAPVANAATTSIITPASVTTDFSISVTAHCGPNGCSVTVTLKWK